MRHFLLLSSFFVTLSSCSKKNDSNSDSNQSLEVVKTTEKSESTPARPKDKMELLSKEEREAIYYAGGLEKEIIRLVLKKSELETQTLLSVLSYAVETYSGIKKNAPNGLDCTRFQLEERKKGTINVYKTCFKSPILVAEILKQELMSSLSVQFFIKEWASVVGLTTSITAADLKCELKIRDKKLSELNCQNWRRSMNTNEELRLTEFSFHKEKQSQIKVVGGIFKDPVEYRKISLIVPSVGKIKVLEKELEVRDDFAEESSGHSVKNIEASTSDKVKENEYLKLQKPTSNNKTNTLQKAGVTHGQEKYKRTLSR